MDLPAALVEEAEAEQPGKGEPGEAEPGPEKGRPGHEASEQTAEKGPRVAARPSFTEEAGVEWPGEGGGEEAERLIQRGVTAPEAAKAAAEKGPRVAARPSFTFWGMGSPSDAAPAAGVSSPQPPGGPHLGGPHFSGSGRYASGGFIDLLVDSASDGGASAPLLHSTKLRALMAVQEGSASARGHHTHHQARYVVVPGCRCPVSCSRSTY